MTFSVNEHELTLTDQLDELIIHKTIDHHEVSACLNSSMPIRELYMSCLGHELINIREVTHAQLLQTDINCESSIAETISKLDPECRIAITCYLFTSIYIHLPIMLLHVILFKK